MRGKTPPPQTPYDLDGLSNVFCGCAGPSKPLAFGPPPSYVPKCFGTGGGEVAAVSQGVPQTPPPPRGGRTERHGLRRPQAHRAAHAVGRLSPMAFLVGVTRQIQRTVPPLASNL